GIEPNREFKNAAQWRAWLAKNHGKEKELWLIFYNKASGKSAMPYEEALEEALCFGWIDSFLRKIDSGRRAIRFSPRKDKSTWSARNKRLAEELIAGGRMTAAGLAKIMTAKRNGSWSALDKIDIRLEMPADLLRALSAEDGLLEIFNILSRTRRKQYMFFVESAKREETRKKRIAEAVSRIREGRHFAI
ncbi:MAG: YdeI/OmpD-associated family protein, partial [Acidobacteriota bacterium]|nr:YdeI/OmpD-associated family protein [Acidobacteriota bacterium]